MPPRAAMMSETCPMAGFAESPEKPSDPPHCRPSVSFDSGAGCRVTLSASTMAKKVSRMALLIIAASDGLFCCS